MIFNIILNYNDTLSKISFIWDQAGRKYLFFYSKYKGEHIPKIWPIRNTYSPTKNMMLGIYLRPQVFYYLPKTWSTICTYYWYLFYHLKYEARNIPTALRPVASTCFFTRNRKSGIYLRLGRLYVDIIFAFLLIKIII